MISLATSLALYCANSGAKSRTWALGWVRQPGTESCVSAQELADRVERVVGRRFLVSASSAEVFVEGNVRRNVQGDFIAELRLVDRAGQVLGSREHKSQDGNCRSLDDKLVLSLSIMIDEDASIRRLSEPSLPNSGEPNSPEWVFGARSGVSVAQGVLPKVAVGVIFAAEIEPPVLPGFWLSFVRWRSQDFRDASGSGAHFELSQLSLLSCPLNHAKRQA